MNKYTDQKPAYSMLGAEQALCISHATLYELIRQEQIRTFKIGRRRYISREALNDFISAREAEMEEG